MPVGFVNPKEKDLTGAERGIASYFKHPMRKTFQRAGKVLTWLLRQLPKSVPHFTLHKLHNLKTRVHKAANNLTTRYKDKTGITSPIFVCNIFTRLILSESLKTNEEV